MNDAELIARLRDGHVCSVAQNSCRNGYAITLAADRLETLTAENERLKQFAKNAERCAHHGLKGDMLVALGDIKREARAALKQGEQ
jgi:hypothetical protein